MHRLLEILGKVVGVVGVAAMALDREQAIAAFPAAVEAGDDVETERLVARRTGGQVLRSRKSTEARFVEMQDLTPGSTYDDLITTPYECKTLDRDEWADCCSNRRYLRDELIRGRP